MYDCTNLKSFETIREWLGNVEMQAPKNTVKILVGNKCDLADKAISTEEAQKLADENNIQFIETSAKTGHNVDKMIDMMVWKIMKENTDI